MSYLGPAARKRLMMVGRITLLQSGKWRNYSTKFIVSQWRQQKFFFIPTIFHPVIRLHRYGYIASTSTSR